MHPSVLRHEGSSRKECRVGRVQQSLGVSNYVIKYWEGKKINNSQAERSQSLKHGLSDIASAGLLQGFEFNRL